MKSGLNIRLQSVLAGLLLAGASGASLSCDAPASNEDLNPEGPPMVRQVFMTEKVTINGSSRVNTGQIAFGTHSASFFDNDDGEVQTAIVLGAQEIRVVMDELLRGNTLEELACADGSWSRIPPGTTPDDITDCAGPVDSLTNCTEVCIDADTGPIGILDEDDDGAVDDMRMIDYNRDNVGVANPPPETIQLGVSLVCDGVNVPLDRNFSFWNPSGNQTFPSNPALTFRGIGPAIVLKPVANVGLRTGARCGITFRPEVVDYDGNQVCAPEGGRISEGCTPGDTSAISFGTEPLKLINSVPTDGQMNVSLSSSSFMLLAFNANIDADSVTAVTLTADGTPVAITPMVQQDDRTSIAIMLEEDFLPETEYQLTVSTDLQDALGGPLPAEATVTWTTAAAQPTPDAAVDAGTPDAAI